MTGVALEIVSEVILFGVMPLFLMVGTIWILWFLVEKINPDEVIDIRSFSVFIVVIVPFVMLICFGTAVIFYDAMAISSGRGTVLPLESSRLEMVLGGAAFFIGQTVWLWSRWRRLRIRQIGIPR